LLVAGIASCGPPRDVVSLDPTAKGIGTPVEVMVASSRAGDDPTGVYGRDRSASLGFARFVVSVPPERAPGTVTMPRRPPGDPRTDFVTLRANRIASAKDFVRTVDATSHADGVREALVFAHGYNNTFVEGLYRQVQMDHDFGLQDVSVNYAWPSAGTLTGYGYDKESALFAGEGLAELLVLLDRTRLDHVTLMGHSMGSVVVMEALRTLIARGRGDVIDRLHAVVLLSPDLDIDLFRQRMRDIRTHPVPIFVFVSRDDRALRASARVHGGRVRLGALTDPAPISDLPVVMIDITNVRSGDALDHEAVATSPLLFGLVSGLDEIGGAILDEAVHGGAGPLDATIDAVGKATKVMIDPLR
jgi:esterase/lipase superfamily enzyme